LLFPVSLVIIIIIMIMIMIIIITIKITIIIIIGICSGISTEWLFIHSFQIELEFRSVDFYEGRKTGEPEDKPSEQG